MDEKEETLSLQQQFDELNESIKALGEKQNAQYTDIMLQLRKTEDAIQELKNSLENPSNDLTENELYEEAKEIVIETRKASASLLQRRLSLGYTRAAQLLNRLEQEGVISSGEGAKPREVLIKEEE